MLPAIDIFILPNVKFLPEYLYYEPFFINFFNDRLNEDNVRVNEHMFSDILNEILGFSYTFTKNKVLPVVFAFDSVFHIA